MKILLVSDYFHPEFNAPANRAFDHSRHWVDEGHDVTVLTCAPNFPKGVIFKGYKNSLYSKETINGVQVIRVWSFVTKNEGYFLRVIDHFSSFLSFIIFSIFVGKHDVIIATSPQFFTAISGFLISKIKSTTFILEVRDIWPEGIIFLNKNSFLYKILEKIELFLYKNSAGLIVVTKSFKESIKTRLLPSKKPINVSFNGCERVGVPDQKKVNELRVELGLLNKFVVGYAGTIGISHKLDSLVEIFEKNEISDIVLILIGEGAEKQNLRNLVNKNKIDNVLVIDAVKREQLINFYALFDLALVHLADTSAYEKVIPSKMLEAIAHNKPLIAGLSGEAANLVSEYRVGEVFQPENGYEFITKAKYLKHKLSKDPTIFCDGIKKMQFEFNKKKQAQSILDFIEKL